MAMIVVYIGFKSEYNSESNSIHENDYQYRKGLFLVKALIVNIKSDVIADVSKDSSKTNISLLRSIGAIYELSGFKMTIDGIEVKNV